MAAVPGRLPLIEPMLATPARAVPGNEGDWAAEAKWDGARVLAYVDRGTVVLRGRGGGDVTGTYPEVAASLGRAAGRRTVILDGEITVFDGDRPSFAMLQRRTHVARPAPALLAAVPVTYVAFDLLWQARSLLRSPYAQRRALLDGLALAAEHVSVPPSFPRQARALADASRELGLEGVVLKRLSSPYQPGQRSGDWLKIRNLTAADVLIGGWLPRRRCPLPPRRVRPGRRPRADRTGLPRLGRVRVRRGRAPRPHRPAAGPRTTRLPVRRPAAGRRRPPGPMDYPGPDRRGHLRRDHPGRADAAPGLARAPPCVNPQITL